MILTGMADTPNTPIGVLPVSYRDSNDTADRWQMGALERLNGFVAAATRLDTVPALKEAVRVAIVELGFDRFAYLILRRPRKMSGRLYFGTYPVAWATYYSDRQLTLHDPTVRHAFDAMQPFLWDDVTRTKGNHDSDMLVFGPAADAGLRSGAAVPIHGPFGGVALLTVSKDCPEAAFQALFAEHRFDLQIIAYAAHDAVLRLAAPQPNDRPVHLTRRQKEVLLWTIHGKTNWEIGEILIISEDTVRQHLRMICRLLGATNRTQAATIAVNRQLISPDGGIGQTITLA